MKRHFLSIVLLISALFFAACEKNTNSSSSGGLLSFDQTEEARAKIIEANGDLKKIKQIFNDSEPRLQELQQAMREKNEAKVREICDDLVTKINAGTEIAEEAIRKIREAHDLNINDDFKEYLRLKIDCLEKYLDAYEKRREAAILLRDGYDPKNAVKRERFLAEFKIKEDEFKVIMEEARFSSEEANTLAIEVLRRKP